MEDTATGTEQLTLSSVCGSRFSLPPSGTHTVGSLVSGQDLFSCPLLNHLGLLITNKAQHEQSPGCSDSSHVPGHTLRWSKVPVTHSFDSTGTHDVLQLTFLHKTMSVTFSEDKESQTAWYNA